nr:hypothetical protein WCOTENJF_WCOTENJF_CDS_0046 [uncultured phage]
MAENNSETIVKLIDVKVEGVESINSLIKTIDDLNTALKGLSTNSAEYKELLELLAKNQTTLSKAMRGVKKDAEYAEGSYYSLQKQLRETGKAFKSTTDEVEKADLAKKYKEINTELKTQDALLGNYQRNVGNYGNSIVAASARIRELRTQIAGLKEGTEEYNKTFSEMTMLTAEQRKLNEQLKFSSGDYGDILGNVNSVMGDFTKGLLSMVTVLNLFGDSSEGIQTAVKALGVLMVVVQGLSIIDQLKDKFKGLIDGIKALKKESEGSAGAMSSMGQGMQNVEGASDRVTSAIGTADSSVKGFTNSTEQSTTALNDNVDAIQEVIDKLNQLQSVGQVDPFGDLEQTKELLNEVTEGTSKELAELNLLIGSQKTTLNYQENLLQLAKDRLAVAKEKGEVSALKEEVEMRETTIKSIKDNIKQLEKENKEKIKAISHSKTLKNSQVQLTKDMTKTQMSVAVFNKNLEQMGLLEGIAAKASLGLGKGMLSMGISTKVATVAMKGFKAALMATGIGALLVIVGELVNLLFKGVGKLADWVSGANKAKKAADDLKSANDALNKSFDSQNELMDFNIRKMEALGYSYEEIFKAKKRMLEAQIAEVRATMATSKAYQEYIKLSEKDKTKKKYEETVEESKRLEETLQNLNKALLKLNSDKTIHDLEEQQKAADEEKKKREDEANERARIYAENRKKEIQDIINKIKELEGTIKEADNLLKSLNEKDMTEDDKIKAEYDKRLEIIKKAYDAEMELNDINKERGTIDEEEYQRRILEIKQKYYDLGLKVDADYNDKNKALLSQRAKDAAEAAVNAINGDYAEKARKKNKDAVTKTVDDLEKLQPKIFSIWEIIMGRDVRPDTLKNKLKVLTDTYNTQMDELTSNFEEKKKKFGEIANVWDIVANDTNVDDDTRSMAQQKALEARKQMEDAETEYAQKSAEARKKYMDDEAKAINEHKANMIQNAQQMLDGLGGIFGSMADFYEEDAEARKEGDAKSQKIAKQSFKKAQNLRIAEATISTLNGAIGAFMQATATYPAPYGAILGAATAAAATAAGIAQIKKIKAQKFEGGSSLGGGSTSFQLPNVEKYEPTYTSNLTQETDTDSIKNAITEGMEGSTVRAYVLADDINAAQKIDEKRQQESTW